MSTPTTYFTKPLNLSLPNAYNIQLPLPMPPVATPFRSAVRTITMDSVMHEWPLTPKEASGSQTIFIGPSIAPGNTGFTVTLDTAPNMIPYFPGVVTGNIYKLEFVNISGRTGYTVRGCTGSNTLGVTGSVSVGTGAMETAGWCQPVYIRWDNVSGSTGSYTIL